MMLCRQRVESGVIIPWDDMVSEDVAQGERSGCDRIISREIDGKVSAVENVVSVIPRTWRNVRMEKGELQHETMEGGQDWRVQKAVRFVGLTSCDDESHGNSVTLYCQCREAWTLHAPSLSTM